jgi:peptidoglycan hydrolase CwlO-like protein
MSTQLVNANRKGPKNLMDLAQKAQAYKAVLEARENNRNPAEALAGDQKGLDERQSKLDDAFETFANLHRNPETGNVDAAEMQATMEYLNKHLQKGKGI